MIARYRHAINKVFRTFAAQRLFAHYGLPCNSCTQRPFCLFEYFVLPKALEPYQNLQKCQKLLANLGSEDTVGRPKNYQAKVPGTVSRTKRSANFSHPQVKHFLGCKKSTKSNTCGSLFTCSDALLFSSTKTAKLQNPCISGHWRFCVHFVPFFDARDSSPEPETPHIFATRP